MISLALRTQGLQWCGILTGSPSGLLSLGPCSLDLIESGARRYHRLVGAEYSGSQAEDAIDSARCVEEARGAELAQLAGCLPAGDVAEVYGAHVFARGAEVIRG